MISDRIHHSRRPARKPCNAQFMSGPCTKRPGYELARLDTSLLGRSRRSEEATARRRAVVHLSRQILGVPDAWRLGIIPGSDMGAMEAAMWGLLGQRPEALLPWLDWVYKIVRAEYEAHSLASA
jgi:phosphoserine aminotransferase